MAEDNFAPSKSPEGEHDLHHTLLDLKEEGKLEFLDSRDEHGDAEMSLTDEGRGAAADLLRNNDDAVLFALKIHFGKTFDDLESVSERDIWLAIADLADTLKDDGVNLFRVLERNPEKTPGIDVSDIPESIIQLFDTENAGNESTGSDPEKDLRTDGGSEPETIFVEDLPKRLLGNLLIDGPDGQCVYVYAGIEIRCPNDAVAHTFTDHGGDLVRVEMCAEHTQEDVPEPSSTDQVRLVPDGGEDKGLLDIDVDEQSELASLEIDAEQHGWSIHTLVENSPEYLADGVESVTANATVMVHEPDQLDQLAGRFEEAASELRRLQHRDDRCTDGGTTEYVAAGLNIQPGEGSPAAEDGARFSIHPDEINVTRHEDGVVDVVMPDDDRNAEVELLFEPDPLNEFIERLQDAAGGGGPD